MISDEKFIDAEEYVKVLKKKLNNFFNNAPIDVSITYTLFFIEIECKVRKKIKRFFIDFKKDQKDFISEIKDYLVEYLYPVIIKSEIKVIQYTDEELSNLLEENSNLCLEDLLIEKKKEKIDTYYRIEKIFSDPKKNEIVVRNLTTNKLELYKMDNMPVLIYLKNVMEKWNQNYSWEVFKNKCKFVKNLNEEKEIK